MGERIVLDLETQREFSEVEGRKPELLGVSVVGLYRYQTNRYEAYLEADLPKLAPILKDADVVIGFNIKRFDLPVLSPHLPYPISQVSTLDILEEVVKHLGHRVSLDSIGQATLDLVDRVAVLVDGSLAHVGTPGEVQRSEASLIRSLLAPMTERASSRVEGQPVSGEV